MGGFEWGDVFDAIVLGFGWALIFAFIFAALGAALLEYFFG